MRGRDFYEALGYLMRREYLIPREIQGNKGNKGHGRSVTERFKKGQSKSSRVYVSSQHGRNSKAENRKSEGDNKKDQSLDNLLKLVQGVNDLMKRKFEEAKSSLKGIDLQVFKNRLPKYELFLKNLYYNALGFTYFSQGEHGQALEYYQKMKVADQLKFENQSRILS